MHFHRLIGVVTLAGVVAILSSGASAEAPTTQPARLKVGDKFPAATVRLPSGEAVEFTQLLAGKPTVVVFYRGKWCPYCQRHLAAVAQVQDQLSELGVQIIAVSPDSPKMVSEMLEETKFPYQVVSDNQVSLARKAGLTFRVDDQTFAKYKTSYNIDLEKYSGETHHNLPVPAVYIVNSKGAVRFAHADEDYTKRLGTDALLEAARAAK